MVANLGFSRYRDTKFYKKLELYWHTKTMVSQGMFPKYLDYRQVKQQLEALEEKTNFLLDVVSWLVKRKYDYLQLV